MRRLTIDKFRRSRELRDKLAASGSKQLVNFFLKTDGLSHRVLEERLFWGQAMIDKMQQGQNKLGSILQEIRQAITAESEV